ncbi:MAG: hypothetical protein AAGG51_01070 [Cyanobacteria bacterium P01_G01_bin.54]
MPISGSNGGVYRSASDSRGSDINIVKLWQQICDNQSNNIDLYSILAPFAQPRQVEIGIGNTCGLTCQHCFLGYPSGTLHQPLTPLPTLINATTTLVKTLRTQIVCVADRDAFVPKRSIPYFIHLSTLRQHHPHLKFGGVTNGLTLHQYIPDLIPLQLNYLDISIDGLKAEHEQLRGIGTFKAVLTNLRQALQHQIATRIFVSTTLTQANLTSALELIPQLSQTEGVQWFNLSPLMAVKLQNQQLQPSYFAQFLDRLTQRLSPLRHHQLVNVLVDIPAYSMALLHSLLTAGWLTIEDLHQDSYGNLYQDVAINSTTTLTLRPELLQKDWWQRLRISADGDVLGGCEALTQGNYSQFALGNIQLEPITAIYARATQTSSPFHQMMSAYSGNSPLPLKGKR